MELDTDLCRKAQERYRWEVRFSGDFLYNSRKQMVEVSPWIKERERPSLGVGCEMLGGGSTYGLLDLDTKNVFCYQPFAAVYSGREHDYQEDLIRTALLHLRLALSDKPAQITFPSALQGFVRSHHLSLLEQDNQEVKEFSGGIVHIYRQGDARAITEVFERSRITNRLPD